MYFLNWLLEDQYYVTGWQLVLLLAAIISIGLLNLIDYACMKKDMEVLQYEWINRGWKNRIAWEDEQMRKSYAESGEILVHEYTGNDGETHFEVRFYEE